MADEMVILDEINGEEDDEGNFGNGADEKAEADDELIIKADADFDIEDVHEEEGGVKDATSKEGNGTAEGEEEGKTGVYQSKRDSEFTSEDFKIEIGGLPKYYGVGQLKKLLNETLQLKAHKVKPASSQHMDRAYVTFRDQKGRDKALAVLDEFKWKGCTLTVKIAEAVEDPILKKVSDIDGDFIIDPTDQTPVNEKVVKSVTPLAHLSYEEQLEQKQKTAYAVLRRLGGEMAKTNPELEDFVRFHKLRRKGQICEVGEILPSPVTEGYRNKCEFTVGTNPENELPTVGFRVSSYKAGSVAVAPVGHLRHISDTMKKVVEVFEHFVRGSEHKPYDPITHSGVWRQLTVRTSSHDDILIAVIVHPQEFTDEQMGDIKQSVLDYFKDGSGASVGVTSIFFQAIGQREQNPEEPQFDHLWGNEYLTETILGKTFQISCESFFQINTKACEVLYETVGELAELDGTSAILDICCGTGTIGISLADQCLRVYGIEMVKKAASDARQNAELNNLENVAIYAGKVEVNLAPVLSQVVKYSTVGVIDPPRAGLSEGVIRALRKCENLNRLIYLSCDPEGAFKNFIDLSRPKSKNYKGEFFIPIKAAVVDMFPHTPHYELLIVFERWEERKWRRIMEGDPLPRDEEYFKRIPAKPDYAYEVDKDEEEANEETGFGSWQSVSKRQKTEDKYGGGSSGSTYGDSSTYDSSTYGSSSYGGSTYGSGTYRPYRGRWNQGYSGGHSQGYYDRSSHGGGGGGGGYGSTPLGRTSNLSSYDRMFGSSYSRPYGSGSGYGSSGGSGSGGYASSDRYQDPYRLSRHEYDQPFDSSFGSYGYYGGSYGGSYYYGSYGSTGGATGTGSAARGGATRGSRSSEDQQESQSGNDYSHYKRY